MGTGRRWRPLAAVAGVVAVAAGVGFVSARDGRTPKVVVEDPGVVHVHGLGVNPADSALYAATHTGLFRVDDDGAVTRIADRYQDTMGFTVAGPDRFLASGHPDLRDDDLRIEDKPPLLGLIESADAGRSWRSRSLLGDADLHAIVAVGDLLVAYDSTGERVLASSDGGTIWDIRSKVSLTDLAVDPTDPDHLAAITIDGSVQASGDGGRTWTPSDAAAPAGLAVLRWSEGGLWAAGSDGTLYRAETAAGAWDAVHRFDGPVEALLAGGDDLYAAVEGSGIHSSRDDGRSWRQLYRPAG